MAIKLQRDAIVHNLGADYLRQPHNLFKRRL